ncbi:unnamed protein product, partial [Musa hybrid cultivar]
AYHVLPDVGPAVGGGEHAIHVVRVPGAVVERHEWHRLQAEPVLAGVHVGLEVPGVSRVHVRHEELRHEALVHDASPLSG